MPAHVLTTTEKAQIRNCVVYYSGKRHEFESWAKIVHVQLSESKALNPYVHSVRYRAKEISHLKDKLIRKAFEAKASHRRFTIVPENLFTKIGDLAGVRILHLHTRQMTAIHPLILELFNAEQYRLIEEPFAYTWDDEYRKFFVGLGIKTVPRDSMYTSVHYVIEKNRTTKMRCEIQVRTLMEEVWGEVSHVVNYPKESKSIACQEQIKVLARVCSGATRLVDSIFASKDEFDRG